MYLIDQFLLNRGMFLVWQFLILLNSNYFLRRHVQFKDISIISIIIIIWLFVDFVCLNHDLGVIFHLNCWLYFISIGRWYSLIQELSFQGISILKQWTQECCIYFFILHFLWLYFGRLNWFSGFLSTTLQFYPPKI